MPSTNSAVADPISLAQHAPGGGPESTSRSTDARPAHSVFPPPPPCSPQKDVNKASERQDEHSARARLRSPGQDSTSALLAPKPKAQQEKKKKKANSGVIGFLTLKEPSMSAWEAYAEAERKKALHKGGKSTVKDTQATRKPPDELSSPRNKRHSLPESVKSKSKEPKPAQSGKSDSTAATERKKPRHIPLSSIPRYSEEMSKHMQTAAAPKVQPEVKSNAISPRAKISLFADQRYSLGASPAVVPPALARLTEHESDEAEEEEDNDTTTDLGLRQERKSPPKVSSLSPAEALEILDMIHMEDLDEASSGTVSPLMSPLTPPGAEGDIDPMLMRVHSPSPDAPEATAAHHSSDESKNNASVRPLRSRTINFSRPRSRHPTSPT